MRDEQRVSFIFPFLKQDEIYHKYYQEIDIVYRKLGIQQPALLNRHAVLMFCDELFNSMHCKTECRKITRVGAWSVPSSFAFSWSHSDYRIFKHLDGFSRLLETGIKTAFGKFTASRSAFLPERHRIGNRLSLYIKFVNVWNKELKTTISFATPWCYIID